MTQYIDKDALVKYIEFRYLEHQTGNQPIGCLDRMNEDKEILSYLDTLEVKEKNFIWNNAKTTVPEDSTNQIICIKEDGLAVSTVGKIVNGTIKWAYLDDLINTNSFNVEVKEVDLDDVIENYIHENFGERWDGCVPVGCFELDSMAEHFYMLGLKAQKGEQYD